MTIPWEKLRLGWLRSDTRKGAYGASDCLYSSEGRFLPQNDDHTSHPAFLVSIAAGP